MVGIYKITSPKKFVYIGQSINIEKRFNQYKKLTSCKNQTKLYRSFLKYGVEPHEFEIIIECEIIQLNQLERFYQDLYNVLDKNGLNCKLTETTDRSGKMSNEVIEKMRLSKIGQTFSNETKEKMSKAAKGRVQSKETIEKIRLAKTGKTNSSEHIEKMRVSLTGRVLSPEHIENVRLSKQNTSDATREKMSLSQKERIRTPHTLEARQKMSLSQKNRIRKPHTAESREKMSIAKKGKPFTKEHELKLREGQRLYFVNKKSNIFVQIKKIKKCQQIKTPKNQIMH